MGDRERLSPLGKAVESYLAMVVADATDGLIHSANEAEQALFDHFMSQGHSVVQSRLLAELLLREMVA